MTVSKRLRFHVLTRDDHTCRYCGRKPPEVELTIDHVAPQALGGTDDPTNLVAACRDCNAGKSSVPPSQEVVAQVAADAELYSAAIQRAAEQALARRSAIVDQVNEFNCAWRSWNWNQHGERRDVPRTDDWASTVENWLARGFPLALLISYIKTTMGQNVHATEKWRYYCGIIWKQLREFERDAAAELRSGKFDHLDEWPEA